jgi:hypothetical protein
MRPVPGGRHCKSCSKTIVDFSQMTYSEIALFMSESEKPVCGFYLPEQLSIENKKINSLPLKLGLSTLLTTTAVSYGQSQIKQDTFQTTIESAKSITTETQEIAINSIDDTLVIKGKVQSFDTSSKLIEVLPFASVIIKGTNIGVACNELGEFNLKYAPNADIGQIHIVISAVAIETKEIIIDFKNQKEINVGLITLDKYKDNYTVFYVTSKKRSWLNKFWRKITFR